MKSLFAGIALAAMAGMLMGGAMKPTLDADDRPGGPQMLAGGSGARATGPFDDGMSFAGYNGRVPDYVLGTDMQKAAAWDRGEPAAEDAPVQVAAAETGAQPAAFAGPTFDAPAPEPVTYPSMAGGVAYAPQAAAPAEPPSGSPGPPIAASLG